MNRQRQLLHEIDVLSFVVIELVLYLDTHPEDRDALRYFEYYKKMRSERSNEYAAEFGPLTIGQASGTGDVFEWAVQPWPWEGGME